MNSQLAGLCSGCRNARTVKNTRGSEFLLCERSRGDRAFARYPSLPVRDCPGFEPLESKAPHSVADDPFRVLT